CSRLSGFKSSLNRVHLKIFHAMEVTSYLTDERTVTLSEQIARTIYRNLSSSQGSAGGCIRVPGQKGLAFGRQNLDFGLRYSTLLPC
ncbi:MAG: hypothetical protein WCK27_09655, partial [Verrucomicrobiota bacterium]